MSDVSKTTDTLLSEIRLLAEAIRNGNSGRERVCARRLVGIALHTEKPYLELNAMQILNTITNDDSLPSFVRNDATTLLQGIRDAGTANFNNSSPTQTALRLIGAIRPEILVCLQQTNEFEQLNNEHKN